MMSSSDIYSRVPSSDTGDAEKPRKLQGKNAQSKSNFTSSAGAASAWEEKELRKRRRAQQMEKINTKIHALLWVLGATAVIYYTDFFPTLLHSPKVNRAWFNVGLAALGVNICIVLYLAVYLPYVKKIDLEWSVYCPRMIPTFTVVGVLCALCFVVGLWPVWGVLTPAILIAVSLGALMSAHFIPAMP